MPKTAHNKRRVDDQVMPVRQALEKLKSVYGPGWSLSNLKRKIDGGRPFQWIKGVHYFESGYGVSSLNVSAIDRELSIM